VRHFARRPVFALHAKVVAENLGQEFLEVLGVLAAPAFEEPVLELFAHGFAFLDGFRSAPLVRDGELQRGPSVQQPRESLLERQDVFVRHLHRVFHEHGARLRGGLRDFRGGPVDADAVAGA
jgi:hypothetical protein